MEEGRQVHAPVSNCGLGNHPDGERYSCNTTHTVVSNSYSTNPDGCTTSGKWLIIQGVVSATVSSDLAIIVFIRTTGHDLTIVRTFNIAHLLLTLLETFDRPHRTYRTVLQGRSIWGN